jgi:CheY-like chemotaxis protein
MMLCRLDAEACASKMRAVLVVDDDAGIREIVGQLLETEGYEVRAASDGLRALEILRDASRRMVVLLDVMMPRFSGQQVLECVATDAALAGRHRFIVMTASVLHSAHPIYKLAQQFEAPVLTKPFSVDSLLDSIEQAASGLEH